MCRTHNIKYICTLVNCTYYRQEIRTFFGAVWCAFTFKETFSSVDKVAKNLTKKFLDRKAKKVINKTRKIKEHTKTVIQSECFCRLF